MKLVNLEIYRAIKYNKITQRFGKNNLKIYKKNGMLGHNAIDWKLNDGDKVYFDCNVKGEVFKLEKDKYGGLGIDIITKTKEGYFKHRYWHLKDYKCKPGDIVETGDLIGIGDNTGYSTGPHLHRGMKEMYKDTRGNYKIKNRDNGYYGGVDYEPYLKNIFVRDLMSKLEAILKITKGLIDLITKLISIKKK